MNTDFPRILALLRKEKGISQKQAAQDLGISQALLSHYEKGIRECGLHFVVKSAKYYEVSSDYLLGLSPDRLGAKIAVEDIPDPEDVGKENVVKGSILPTLNKKLIANSLNIIYDGLAKSGSKELTNEMSTFLMLAIYRMFRILFESNKSNHKDMFNVPKFLYKHYASAAMQIAEANATAIANGEKIPGIGVSSVDTECFATNTLELTESYPLFVSSLLNLIKNSEEKIIGVDVNDKIDMKKKRGRKKGK